MRTSPAIGRPVMHSGALVGIANLSRLDCSDQEVVKDCEHDLARCESDAAFAAWARKWGGVLVLQVRDGEPPEGWVSQDAHDEVEAQRDNAESALEDLQKAAVSTVWNIRAALAGSHGPKTEAITDLVAALHEAVTISMAELDQ